MEGVELQALFVEMDLASAAVDVTKAPEENSAFGDRVTLHGLAAELDGRVGTVHAYRGTTGRYEIRTDDEGF